MYFVQIWFEDNKRLSVLMQRVYCVISHLIVLHCQGTRQTMESHHTTTAQSHLSLVCKLAVDQQRQIEDLTRRLAAVSALQAAPDGSFVWRVDGFKAKAGVEVLHVLRPLRRAIRREAILFCDGFFVCFFLILPIY